MNLNHRIIGVLLGVFLGTAPAAAQHPNLVVVIADQMRGSAMGFLGEEPVRTPRLDRFAAQSIVFTHAASNYPICSPFRGMFMTGQYPFTNGVTSNCLAIDGDPGVELSQESRTWSDVLAGQGYALGYIGKWHLEAPRQPYVESYNNSESRAWNEWTPPERRHGFQFWHGYNTYDQHLRPMYWSTGAGRQEFQHVDEWGPIHEADQAVAYIRNDGGVREGGKPFALVVSMNPPHTPYSEVPQRYVDSYAGDTIEELTRRPNIPPAGTEWGDHYRKWIRHYYGMITGVDEQFGRILEALDQTELSAETLVVFTADHGNHLGIHNHGTKGQHYEESVRIPLIFRYPGKLRPRRDDLLFSVPDLYPTMLDLMGFVADIPAEVEGASHARLMKSGDGLRPTSQFYLSVGRSDPARGRRGVRTRQYTLRIDRDQGATETVTLHDNDADPYQLVDIAGEHPKVVETLRATELKGWLEKTNDPWQN
jgi:arylsulfatase A-like enzyme